MSETMSGVEAIFDRLRKTSGSRTEADIQADVRALLLSGDLDLGDSSVRLESPLGDLRRIDVEVGHTVIEVKRDLASEAVLRRATEQLAGYVKSRQEAVNERYVGILTDGRRWLLFHLVGDALQEVARLEIGRSTDSAELFAWLDGALATVEEVSASPVEIVARLGIESSAHALDRASVAGLFEEFGHLPTVVMKRQLWARLLQTALGTQFADDDDLFITHTLLVNMAEIIAHAVVGIDVTVTTPSSLLRGGQFEVARISGVVEADFFDWVLEVDGGPEFIRALARRLARFAWSRVDQDIMKVVYESVIGTETRKKLGEYYTPDWLASFVVKKVFDDPLQQRLLDPACGSGTFLFHAVRSYLDSSHESGLSLDESLRSLGEHVIGIDLHPVAVALARVTYLLAIGRERLTSPDRGPITVPVFLGDSLQWDQVNDLWNLDSIVVKVDDGAELFSSEMRFPSAVIEDAGLFDQLVRTMAERSAARTTRAVPSIKGVLDRLGVREADRESITTAFETMCRLHDEGRDHIWGYYIRNLVRPAWLTRSVNRVDVLVGNPPWLAYRHMSPEMQDSFRKLSTNRNLWAGKKVATHQDLSSLFVARVMQLYLTSGGRFGFVMPSSVLDREHYEGFRQGDYADPHEPLGAEFDEPWDLSRLRPHFFPRAASVVFGKRVDSEERAAMSTTVERWIGRVDAGDFSEIERCPADVTLYSSEHHSPYHSRFRQGATIVPRALFFVEPQDSGPLGAAVGSIRVKAARSSTEKKPWKELERSEGNIEAEFLRSILVGSSVLPFRIAASSTAVLPWSGGRFCDVGDDELDLYPGLAAWWRNVNGIWEANRRNDKLSLLEQLDFRSKLSHQYPSPSRRVVYASSGMHVVGAYVDDRHQVIDNSLYWAAVRSEAEGHFLSAILNAPVLTELCRPMMSYGKDERHIHKIVWRLPIPEWDPEDRDHRMLAELGARAASLLAGVHLSEDRHFATLRRDFRKILLDSGLLTELDELVGKMVAPGDPLG